ncbi:MAG: hypothetical protein CMP23_03430 [Rickettsiales bacterium]|nr:hypothetical protein [Rickettsiales bacterium]|tara:strand:+ start:461 stop:868 length:408 start_codon:yes stop_codon:yes gene_type:complete
MIRRLLGKLRGSLRDHRQGAEQAESATPAETADAMSSVKRPDCEVRIEDRDCSVAVHAGKTLLDAITRAGLALPHECGGLASCGECHIAKAEGEISERREIETRILKIMGKPLDGRLACQTLVFGNARVWIDTVD